MRPKLHQITLHGMPGQGRTLTDAKADAASKLESAMAGSYTPKVFSYAGNTACVWRTPFGACSALADSKTGKLDSGVCFYGMDRDLEAICEDVCQHLAQIGCDVESNECPAIVPPSRVRSFAEWVGFQRAYRHFKAIEPNEHLLHRKACDHAANFAPMEWLPSDGTAAVEEKP